ncbi:hypothetical protein C8R44DRAFT_988339 [Mycena epipterygia]|nr:hypothetical protein C8R44DRAFT_988339 [Mycena epipterygia]
MSVSAHGPGVHLDAASVLAMHIRTDFVQSPQRRVHPNPPVPSSTMPLAAAERIFEGLCAPLAPTDRRKATTSFLGKPGNENLATAECTRARMFGEAKLAPSLLDILLNAPRFYTAASLRPPPHTFYIALTSPFSHIVKHRGAQHPPVHQRHPPYPSRPHEWSILAPGDRRTRPPVLSSSPVAFIRLSTMLSPSPCQFPRMSLFRPGASAPATTLPPSNDASPAPPSVSPRAFVRKPQYVVETVYTHAAYNELVASVTPPTSHPHPPPRSRAGPSRSCDPSPRHAQGPPHFYEHYIFRRLLPPHPPHVTHDLLVPSQRRLFDHASAALDGSS